ncbi:MAG: cupredoxin domain-containing protein [bacterium]
MRKQEFVAILLLLICSIVTVLAVFAYESFRKQQNTVELLAQAPDKGNWSPRIIKVEKDKKITLVIRNVDVVTHGFYLPAFDVMVREIKAGEVEKITFVPDITGEYPFYCSVWCSDYHMQMRGKLIVK